MPPTVLRANTGAVICNLRMTKVAISASDYQILIAWQENSTLFYRVYNPITATLSVPYSLGAVGQTCFRSFDITGVSWSQIAQPSVLWAACSADLGAAGPAPLYCESTFIDPVTGAPSLNASLADAMAKAPPGAGSWYRAWAQRGVVLEQEPSGTVALSARVITQYYSPVPAVATGKLDGQLWTVILTPTFLPGFNISLDWYNINLTGQINTISQNLILSTCTTNINDPLCSALVFGGTGGALSIINRVPVNINAIRTSGMDIQANYATDLWDGQMTFGFTANYVDEITIQSFGATTPNDYAGVLGAGLGRRREIGRAHV